MLAFQCLFLLPSFMKSNAVKYLLIAIIGACVFIPMLGNAHLFDWDEANFAECAREMIISKNWLRVQIDFQPFWEKPPLFIWLQAISMKLFGINEFAARLPNACIGIATLCTLFYVGKKVTSERTGWWWVGIYLASWLPHLYFKSGIIDPTFNYFIFLSFYQLWLLSNDDNHKIRNATLSGVFLGLATLTKGPVAILIALLSFAVYIVIKRGIENYKIKHLIILAASCALVTFLWFGIDIILNGWWFTKTFITYQIRLLTTQDAGHGGPFYYHFIILLIGCFPASIFLFQAGKKSRLQTEKRSEKDFNVWMWILLLVTLILFSIVKTKIVHYSSLCYFPLTFIAARLISQLVEKKTFLKNIVVVLFGIIGIAIAIAIAALPWLGSHIALLKPYIADPFALQNMNAQVAWSSAEMIIGIVYLLGLIAVLLFLKKYVEKSLIALLLLQVIIIEISLIHFTPKIEAYSQGAAIDYYKSFSGKDVYLAPLGFKSYAYLFYSDKMPSANKNYYTSGTEWLIKGQIDKPAFFICKNYDAKKYLQYPTLQYLGEKNGYVFLMRKE